MELVGRTGLDLGWTSRRCMFAQSLSEGSAKAPFGFVQQQRELTEPCDSVCSCKPITTKQTIHRCSKTGDDRHSTQLLRIASLWPPTRHKTECQGLRGRWPRTVAHRASVTTVALRWPTTWEYASCSAALCVARWRASLISLRAAELVHAVVGCVAVLADMNRSDLRAPCAATQGENRTVFPPVSLLSPLVRLSVQLP